MAWMRLLWLSVFVIGCSNLSTAKKRQAEAIARARINLGLAYLEQGHWQRARQNFEIALAAAPDNANAHMGLAYYLQQVNEDEQALNQFKQALALAPNEPNLLNNYAVFLCHIGNYNEAEKTFLRAINQKGYHKLSASYENAGLCAVKFNHEDKAKTWFEKAINHEPNRYLSTLYLLKLGMKDTAIDSFEARMTAFHQQYGYHAETLFALIKIQKIKKQRENIEKYARLLAEQFPQSQEYRQYLDNEF